MANDAIIRRIWASFEPELLSLGYELVEVEFAVEGSSRILRIYIDKEDGGIMLSDCTSASHLLSMLLDADDYINEEYLLEVSSPGIARPLRKPQDFARFVGQPVRIEMIAASGGRRKFTGVLEGFQDGLIVLECDGERVELHIENLKKANLIA